MAKPRVFISSTFYDLKHVRAELDNFLETLGYEPIRNEEGDISYGSQEELENYCYSEIKNADILISIIGGRYGSESKNDNSYSISQQELKTALDEKKQVYIFIEKNVNSEYNTYLLNKGNENIKYKYVDNSKIYSFIEEIKKLKINNNIKDFESVNDITKYLKEQFAGLFQRFLDRQAHETEVKLIDRLEATSKNLDNLVTFLTNENKTNKKEIRQILMLNHSLILWLKEKLTITYNFYILDFNDLRSILRTQGFFYRDALYIRGNKTYFEFSRLFFRTINQKNEEKRILISTELFDEQNKLKYIEKNDFKEDITAIYENKKFDINSDDSSF